MMTVVCMYSCMDKEMILLISNQVEELENCVLSCFVVYTKILRTQNWGIWLARNAIQYDYKSHNKVGSITRMYHQSKDIIGKQDCRVSSSLSSNLGYQISIGSPNAAVSTPKTSLYFEIRWRTSVLSLFSPPSWS
ncbi:hypothetical protein Dsin_017579 [Dipteronia sinensis]|uniref:Uncharacterized protein n=1 Tax=Dipteronia sinensis TaxID=43782 RepID=A0AAE0E813_9ROSI|nr:hypothetical protein Dsin_017579 [Dipteronia sinensis]